MKIELMARCALVFAASFFILSCSSHEDLRWRYELEKKMWKAQMLERSLNIDILGASEKSIALSIKAYKEVIAYDPEGRVPQANWDQSVVADIRRMIVLAKMALADLYFLSDKYYLAGELYHSALEDENVPLIGKLNARLNLARTSYFTGKEDSLELQCAAVFKELMEGEAIWEGNLKLRDAFLNIPAVLLQIYKSRGDKEKFKQYSETANAFYARVISQWPDSLIAEKARLKRVEIHMIEENWSGALKDLSDLLRSPYGQRIAPELELTKGKVLFLGKRDYEKAKSIFKGVIEKYPGSKASYEAKLGLVSILSLKRGQERALEILKEIEKDTKAPSEYRAGAMLWSATHLEQRGNWSEARLLLRRVQRLFPETSSAMQAALITTVHYANAGDTISALRNVERVKDFYLEIIEGKHQPAGRRLAAEDYLIENFMIVGKSREAAKLLWDESKKMDWPADVGALLRSAVIFAKTPQDRAQAREILKKCIELYPKTLYAKRAGELLDEMAVD